MEEENLLKLLQNLGSSGVVAWVLWIIAKRFIEQHSEQVKVTQQEMSKRIDASEKKHEQCEEDRRHLNEKLIALLTKPPEKPNP